MKPAHFVNKVLTLIIFLWVSFGCDNKVIEPVQPTHRSPTISSDVNVEQLVERAFQKSTQAEYDSITVAYQALSLEQLELFNQLKMKSDNKRIAQKLAKSGARVDEQQLAMVAQALSQINAFRNAINKRSVELYGVPYNQLADSVVNNLLDEHAQTYFDVPTPESLTDPNARLSQPTACSAVSYSSVAEKTSSGTTDWTGWTRYRTPKTSDCDYEYRYPGVRFDFDPKDWFANRLCDSFNNRLFRRYTYSSNRTRLLFGNRGVWLWIGHPDLLSVDMY